MEVALYFQRRVLRVLYLWPHAHTKLPKIQQILDHYSGKLMNDKVVSLEDYKIKMALE